MRRRTGTRSASRQRHDVLPVDEDAAASGSTSPMIIFSSTLLPVPERAEDGQVSPRRIDERQLVEHVLRAERLARSRSSMIGVAHSPSSRSVLVRTKSAISVVIDVTTTVSVVARPTPSVPPRVASPRWQAMRAMATPKKTRLDEPAEEIVERDRAQGGVAGSRSCRSCESRRAIGHGAGDAEHVGHHGQKRQHDRAGEDARHAPAP